MTSYVTDTAHRVVDWSQREPKVARLISAVETVWLEHGDLGLTIRRLCSAADTTSQTVYTYWGSREALIHAVTELMLAEVGVWAFADLADWLAAGLDHPAAWRALVIGHGPDGDGRSSPDLAAARSRLLILTGGEAELAKLDGLVSAVVAGRLDQSAALAAVR